MRLQMMASTDIASQLGLKHYGKKVMVYSLSSAESPVENSITFATTNDFLRMILRVKNKGLAIITSPEALKGTRLNTNYNAFIISKRPRLAFIKAYRILSVDNVGERKIRDGGIKAFVDNTARVGKGCNIYPSVTIEKNVRIGSNTTIYPGAYIAPDVRIGKNVIIHPGAVIGKDGFGYERDDDNSIYKFPHIRSVIIEDNVEIGAGTVIDRGTMRDTHIRYGTKIDNLVHIAHGVIVGRNCLIVAGTCTGGSDEIGDNVWIGTNATIIDRIRIGDNSTIGIGAVVVRDVENNTTVAGNPAMPISDFIKIRTALKKIAHIN